MKAKCHLLMGNWSNALDSAEQVLKIDKKFVKAIFVKAESLYNTCSFEHALMYYYRGQVRIKASYKEQTTTTYVCRNIGLT
jgi:tetratricopeptide (TPR) repeat protein